MLITKASPVTALSGCGKKRAELLSTLGIETVGDLLRHFPRGYQDRGNVRSIDESEVGNTGAFVLTVSSAPTTVRISGGRTLTKCKAFDGDKSCTLVFFNRNYLNDILYTGCTYRFWGKLTKTKKGYELSPSVIEEIREEKALSDLVPLYPLTKGLTQNFMKAIILTALNSCLLREEDDCLPLRIRERLSVCGEGEAYACIHNPKNEAMIKKGRDRFIAEELFLFACSVNLAKQGRTYAKGKQFEYDKCKLYDFTDKLPFTLTKAQSKVISEIRRDMVSEYPMARLVSGDVGSGKTVCAMAAAYMAIKNGYQCAMMAPTEILAMQHYRDFSELFSKLGIECGFLTGSVTAANKRKTVEKLKSGELKLVVGTHALISQNVEFDNLGLVITDEQHRFGVAQRTSLQNKTAYPHVLVMSATPIPRTLALILLGDLDISVIDELPPGRQTVDTYVVGEAYRARLNAFIGKQVNAGRQVYIVCPSIEAKEETDEEISEEDILTFDLDVKKENMPKLKSAVEYEQNLRNNVFPSFNTAFVHGKMSGKEKDSVMKRFNDGEIDILVSTTVIEVGVNVPNATLMIIENAERFGLSQLHQLRGRVGRGAEKSYCILVSDSSGENARKRLEIMKTVSNGYKIAEQDLEIRGPGDFISPISGPSGSAKQHGAFGFKLAGFCSDSLMLEKVFKIAQETVINDPELKRQENVSIAAALSAGIGLGISGVN
ncbi:MAG: ATP-dependent DNA helicase RecG [Clostridia bacterium]|nr:ATP-dependent DNA helicase RecG [Clostridia bacterium]